MFNLSSEMQKIRNIIASGAKTAMTETQFLESEITKWKKSQKRKDMITGSKYYNGDHEILNRQRTIIGQDGLVQVVFNLPNNKIIDNQYAKMVDQKKNYLLGKPLTFDTENKQYEDALKEVFNKRFQRTLKNLGEDSLNGGIGWLHPYYNDQGVMCFKRFEPFEILPFWKDADHTELDYAVRLYEVQSYEGTHEVIVEKVEVYTLNGIKRYVLLNNKLIPDVENPSSNYITFMNNDEVVELNWDKIPLIAFKYNNKEIPLIKRVKQLQDGINIMLSDFENNMQEDARNTILVIENYDGTDLAQFRHNLATFGAVKVKTVDGAKGGVSTLTVEVNSDNYKSIVELFKKALIENARGYDAKDERMNGNPNQMNIQSMYSDIDLDANEMETEYQAAFEELLWFVNTHLNLIGSGYFFDAPIEVIFNRDILINESTVIDNLSKSVGILSNRTLIANHPWIQDVNKEIETIDREKQEAMDEYQNAFNPINPSTSEGGDGDEE